MVIGTTEVIQAVGVIVDQMVIRIMKAQATMAIETMAEVVLLVGFQKVPFFVMAIPLFVIQVLPSVR
jgi:hypothetical protein